jgi:hypothetical protein
LLEKGKVSAIKINKKNKIIWQFQKNNFIFAAQIKIKQQQMLRSYNHINVIGQKIRHRILQVRGKVMLHHKVYQNQLILITAPTKSWGFFM